MASGHRAWLRCLLAGALAAAAAEVPETCPAGEVCGTKQGGSRPHYHWPGPFGRPESYGNSPYVGPFDLTASLKWTWHHPDGAWADMPLAAVIDDKNNVYVSADQGVYRLSPEGKLLWSWQPPILPGRTKNQPNLVPNGPALEDGRLFINDVFGRFWALDMETGFQIWETRPAVSGCMDTGFVAVHKGVVIAETDTTRDGCHCVTVRALNASTGQQLWEYKPDAAVWDLMVQFDDEDTIFFQDLTGKAYRNGLFNGTNIWKNGGWPGSWTDGTQFLAANGIVYTTNTNNCGGPDCHGMLTAYNAADGSLLWKQETPRPPNVSPVVGKLGPGDRLSVVIPIGQQPSCDSVAARLWQWFPSLKNMPDSVQWGLFSFFHWASWKLGDLQAKLWSLTPLPTAVMAFDALTGEPQWTWQGPTHMHFQCPGDEKWYLKRMANGIRSASCPTPWSAPRIGGDGTIYVGNQNGHFFAIKDHNGDGSIDPVKDVHDFDCGAEFSSAGSAHGPGLVVIASGDIVYAFGS